MLYKRMIAAVMVSVVLMPSLASAEGLLGGVLGGGSGGSGGSSLLGVVGGSDSGALVTLGSGNAGTSGLVNLGVGGTNGLVTANVGANDPVIGAQVLGPKGIVDVDLNLGDVGANVNVGGPNLIDIDLNLPKGGNGGNGGNGNGNNGANGGNGQVIVRNGVTMGNSAMSAACAGYNTNQLVALFNQSTTRGWDRVTGIQLVPIKVCADLRRQMANWLASSGDYHNLVGAVSQDPLINAALSRSQYQAGHVLGVHKQGSTLMVYVF